MLFTVYCRPDENKENLKRKSYLTREAAHGSYNVFQRLQLFIIRKVFYLKMDGAPVLLFYLKPSCKLSFSGFLNLTHIGNTVSH